MGISVGVLQELCAEQPWIGIGSRVQEWVESQPSDRIRLSLRSNGIYQVSAQEIATASGWDQTAVVAAMATTNLYLSSQGQPVPWTSDGELLYFYGEEPTALYAAESVYWIEMGTGVCMTEQDATPVIGGSINPSFISSIKFEGRGYVTRMTYSTLTNAPLMAFNPRLRPGGVNLTTSVMLPHVVPGEWCGNFWAGMVSFYYPDTYNQKAKLYLNSVEMGEATWSGEKYDIYHFPFSSDLLQNGSATVVVTNAMPDPVSSPFVNDVHCLCTAFGFDYPRLYWADDNVLYCRGGAMDSVAITGFTTNSMLVLDVSEPATPILLNNTATSWSSSNASWQVTFAAGDSNTYYQVVGADSMLQPSVRGTRNMQWENFTAMPEYAILIPSEGWRSDFRAAIQPLADYRNNRGLRTMIIDVETIYNQYSFGMTDPAAIRSFVTAGYSKGLRYLLLAGGGSLNFKHYKWDGNDHKLALIPTFIAGQKFSSGDAMIVALDALMGDIDGDNRPDIAVGRIPANTVADLSVVVNKTLAFEIQRQWQLPLVLVADWENTGAKYYNFRYAVEKLLPILASVNRSTIPIYRQTSGDGSSVRTEQLLPALQAGASVFHFIGHSNLTTLGDGIRLFYHADITTANWQIPVISIFMGCRINRWHEIYPTSILQPTGLLRSGTGFVACIGATGDILDVHADTLSVKLYTKMGKRGRKRLGDIWQQSLWEMGNNIIVENIQCVSLTGDPALELDIINPPTRLLLR